MSKAVPFRLSNPAGLYDPAPNGYSHLASVDAGSRMLLVAGQGGENAAGELADGFEAQVSQALANLRTALAAGGADLAHVAKLTVLIVDHSEARLHAFGALLSAAWGALPTPACTLIPVPRLALDGMLFEIEATAFLPG
ncbi:MULTISPECIES: RidA family protein [Chromobacterium]|uniref:RidA family protein n=1 Tax=Chromobacterium aquaticum TaxID=467180 RepID=A0ABV8ZY25_9NEIS|nr:MULTISPECIES: Rid family hydrolase [Chromobacterium]KMN38319.1 endoribonuclease L-PSP [Chromobacterium sp. LK1]MCD5364560.1 RidA family protein [Chromobacterium aquaticum]